MTTQARLLTITLAVAVWLTGAPAAAQDDGPERGSAHVVDTLGLQDTENAGKRALTRQQAYLQELYDAVAPSVISIARDNGAMGTGFFVDANGLALTHARVVGDQDDVDVILHDGRKMKAPVVERVGGKLGVALIDVAIGGTRPLLLTDTSRVQTGTWLGSVVHGYGGASAIRSGHLSSLPSDDKKEKFEVQIPMDSTASGAPIFDIDGHVVGIADTAIGESRGINLGVRSAAALETLDALRERCVCLRVEAPKGKPIFVDGRIVGKGPSAVVLVHPGKHEVFSIIEGRMKKTTVNFPEEQKVVLE